MQNQDSISCPFFVSKTIKSKMKIRKFKKYIAVFLTVFMISSSVCTAYAVTGLEEAVVASSFGGPEAVIAVLAICGVVIAVENREAIGEFLDNAIHDSCIAIGISNRVIKAFYDKVKQGVIDTTSSVWNVFKSKLQSWVAQEYAKQSSSAASFTVVEEGSTLVIGNYNNGLENKTMSVVLSNLESSAPVYLITAGKDSVGVKSYYLYLYSSRDFSASFLLEGKEPVEYTEAWQDEEIYYLSWEYTHFSFDYFCDKSEVLDIMHRNIDNVGDTDIQTGSDISVDVGGNTAERVFDISSTDTEIDFGTAISSLGYANTDELCTAIEIGAVDISDVRSAADVVSDTYISTEDIVTDIELVETIPEDDTKESVSVADVTTDSSAEEYKVALIDIFPFCIPFDIYNLFSALVAEPEAPSFEWKFFLFGEDYAIMIDLSIFDTVASILRNMELIVFILGLALLTPKVIKW